MQVEEILKEELRSVKSRRGSGGALGSNRVGRELMDVHPSLRVFLRASLVTEGPARPLPSITMHAAGAPASPNVSNNAVNLRAWGSAHRALGLTRLAYGLRRIGC